MHYLDYNEKKQHGTPDFPIEYYHVDEHHPVITCHSTVIKSWKSSGFWRESSI